MFIYTKRLPGDIFGLETVGLQHPCKIYERYKLNVANNTGNKFLFVFFNGALCFFGMLSLKM